MKCLSIDARSEEHGRRQFLCSTLCVAIYVAQIYNGFLLTPIPLLLIELQKTQQNLEDVNDSKASSGEVPSLKNVLETEWILLDEKRHDISFSAVKEWIVKLDNSRPNLSGENVSIA